MRKRLKGTVLRRWLAAFLCMALVFSTSGLAYAQENAEGQSVTGEGDIQSGQKAQEEDIQSRQKDQKETSEGKEDANSGTNLFSLENPEGQNENAPKTGMGVTATLRVDGYNKRVTAPVSVTLPDIYKTYGEYGLTGIEDPGYYTTLHLMAQYCVDKGLNPAAEIQMSGGYLQNFLKAGVDGAFWMFEVNNVYQVDGTMNGYTIPTCPVKSNDYVVLYDWKWSSTSAYAYFTDENMSVKTGEVFNVTLRANSGMWTDMVSAEGSRIIVQDTKGNEVNCYVTSGTADANGTVRLSISEPGTYILTAERVTEGVNGLNRPYAKVTVGEQGGLTDAEAVESAQEFLSLGDVSAVDADNMQFPTTGIYGTTIDWEIENGKEKYASWFNESYYCNFYRPIKEDVVIKFTAYITKGEQYAEKEFEVILKGKTADLASLSVNYGTLSFDPALKNYVIYVPMQDAQGNEITQLTVTTQAKEMTALLSVNSKYNYTGTTYPVNLEQNGKDTKIIVKATVYSSLGTIKNLTEETIITVKRAENLGEPLEELPENTWGQRLGDDSNNALTGAATPTDQSELLWKSFSGGEDVWGMGTIASGMPILVNNSIYAVRNHKIEMLDAKTGEMKGSASLDSKADYYSYITYGGGMVFVPLENGQIQCFNAKTLKSMYLTELPALEAGGLHMLSSVYYNDGKIYVGYTNYAKGYYAAFDTVDLNAGNEKEIITPLWKTEEPVSYYGAGAVTVNQYILLAGDGGAVSVRDAVSGTEISKCQLEGNVRDALVYADGYVWLTTSTGGAAGNIYKLAVAADGSVTIAAEAALPNTSNTSPVVTGGKVYVTGGDFDNFGFLAVYDANLTKLAEEHVDVQAGAPTVTTAYDDVYAYFTENQSPGILYSAKVSATNKITLTKLYVPENAQASMSMVVAGADGTLYYGNDSGYLFAITKKSAEPPKEDPEKEDPKTDVSDGNTGTTGSTINAANFGPKKKTVIKTSAKETKSESESIAEAITSSGTKGEKMLTIKNVPEVLEASVFAALKEQKDLSLVLDCGTYTISLKGSDVTDTNATLNTRLVEMESTLEEEQAKQMGIYQQLALVQEGPFPGKLTIVYQLPEQLKEAKELYLYGMDDLQKGQKTVVQTGYAMFDMEQPGMYVLSDAEAEDAAMTETSQAEDEQIAEELLPGKEETKQGLPTWACVLFGVLAGAVVGGVVTGFVVSSKRKKEDTWVN